MAYSEITAADLLNKGVEGLPDTPGLTAAQMQHKFDEIAKDVIVPKFNAVVQKLNDPSGADDIQVTDPTTGTQNNLNGALQNIEDENALNTLNRHNHANLATLDAIDATTKADYDRLVSLLTAVNAIQNVLSGAVDEIPTGKATSDAIQTVQDEVDLNTLARHTHDNKATLDDITALVKQGYDDIVTLLSGITGIETTLTNSNDKIARSDAVYTAVDNLAAIVALNTAARHTHANKATLDAIDALTKQAYDDLVTTFSGKTIEQTVTNDANKLPSGAAVVAYVQSLGGGDMTKAVYDTNDDGTVDSADYATNAGHATTADSATSATSAASATYATSAGSATSATTATSATNANYATSAGDSSKLGGMYSSFYAESGDLQTLFGDVATYQSTSTALRNYAVGDFMIYENNFYEVTQAIASGGTIVKNTNVTKKTIGEVLTALASATPADMTGATSLLPGTHGLVPAPAAGDEDKVLKGDGTWGTPGDSATVRYIPLTDKIQLWDGSNWVNWKTAGLKLNPIFADGILSNFFTPLSVTMKKVTYMDTSAAETYFRIEDGLIKLSVKGTNVSSTDQYLVFLMTQQLNFTDLYDAYHTMRVKGTVKKGTGNTTGYIKFGIYDADGNALSEKTITPPSPDTVEFTFNETVALPISGVGYLGFTRGRYNLGYGTLPAEIERIELEE